MKIIYCLLFSLIIVIGCSEKKLSRPQNEPLGKRSPEIVIEDSTNNATDVLKNYYKAINEKDFQEAYNYWEGNGSASKQSFEDFKKGFAETATSTIQVGDGHFEGAAGSIYIDLPVKLKATMTDGSNHFFKGSYTLRRSISEEATKRKWHIYSAKIAEVK